MWSKQQSTEGGGGWDPGAASELASPQLPLGSLLAAGSGRASLLAQLPAFDLNPGWTQLCRLPSPGGVLLPPLGCLSLSSIPPGHFE